MAHADKRRGMLGLLVVLVVGLLTLVGGTVATGAPPDDEPGITTEKKWEREEIPFRTITRKTPKLDKGVTKVSRPGRVGVLVRVVETTRKDGVEIKRKVLRKFVARRPAPRVVLVGTRTKQPDRPRCDPNYSGCVPIASDVDCAGGSGNGPAYVQGPVRVIGNDIYDLDADGDGWGCE